MGRGRKKAAEGEGGAPGWVVTYGDMMSLLLTFFILLLSFSTISEEAFKKAASSLQGAFGALPSFNHIIGTHSRKDRTKNAAAESTARKLREQMQILGREKQVKIEYDARGGIKISLPNSLLFEQSSATLKPEAAPVLEDIGKVLSGLPDTFIEVKGHTDSQVLMGTIRFRDNYELSYFRADAVMRQLNAYGNVPSEQFELVACGPNQPLASNNTEEGRQSNRRVEIFVRGLVDKSKIEALGEGSAVPGSVERIPDRVLTTPQELTELR